MASIQRVRRGAWRVRVYEGRDDSGRKRYRSRTVRVTRRDAQRVASNLHLEVELGVAASGGRASLAEYLRNRWLPHVRLHRRPNTYARYAGIVTRCITAMSVDCRCDACPLSMSRACAIARWRRVSRRRRCI